MASSNLSQSTFAERSQRHLVVLLRHAKLNKSKNKFAQRQNIPFVHKKLTSQNRKQQLKTVAKYKFPTETQFHFDLINLFGGVNIPCQHENRLKSIKCRKRHKRLKKTQASITFVKHNFLHAHALLFGCVLC